MNKPFTESTLLNNGVKMPWLGLGVWKVADGDTVANTVKTAIQVGYRSIDTATIYRNETGVGQGIRDSEIPREELFITTKVWNADQGYSSTIQAFDESLRKLGLDYLDMYLIHWPWPGKEKYKATWKAMETLYKQGRVRAIGVCNFHEHHLDELLADCEIVPAINQVEYHPRLTQEPLHAYCRQHGIQLEAWSPLMQGGDLLTDPTVMAIAESHDKTPAQIILRWDLQNGVVTIPKTVNQYRMVENSSIFDFVLTDQEMAQIQALNKNQRVGFNPDKPN